MVNSFYFQKVFVFDFFLLNLLTFIEILSRITSTLPYENE